MAWTLVQSTSCFPWAVPSGSKIHSKQSTTKRSVIHYKVMRSSLQTPPIYMSARVRTFSGGVNSLLCNIVNNKSHYDFHSSALAATSSVVNYTEKISFPMLLPEGVMFTERAKEVIRYAQNMARVEVGFRRDGTETILLGLIIGVDICTDDIAAKVFRSMDIRYIEAAREINKIMSYPTHNPFTPRAFRVFELALAEALELEHLLLGLLHECGGGATHILRKLGACPINIRSKVMRMIAAQEVVGDGSSGNETPTFEYGVNLTELAKEKKLHPVFEKQPLINTVIEILGRPSKNNPYLFGEDGVGKTSIVEGLAQRIADSDVPHFLRNKKVITLDKRLLVHGSYGKFNERLKKLMEEIKECNEMILFIDDFCTSNEAREPNYIDAVNNLIGAVARGELQCVMATNNSEYPKEIKNNPAFETLFQPVVVPDATVDETIKILMGLQQRYENHHKVRYTDEALVVAAHLSYQNLTRCLLPGQAIDVIDAAGLLVSLSHKQEKVSGIINYDTELICVRDHRRMTREVISAWRHDNYYDVVFYDEVEMFWDELDRNHMLELAKQRMEEMENDNDKSQGQGPIVTIADIEVIFSYWQFFF